MILSRKVRIIPTKEQESQLWKSAGIARWAYNWALSKQEEHHINGGKFLSDSILRKELTQLKKTEEFIWLYEVSNNVTKQAIKDLCNAYKRFFKGLAEKPRFKSRKHSKSSFYNDNEKLKVKKNSILIEKVGWVKITERIPMSESYKNPRITYDGKYWFLSISIEQDIKKKALTTESIGIDVGIKDLAVCSNGMIFKNINKTKVVKQVEKRLRRLQRQSSRKYEINNSKNCFVKTRNIIKLEKKIRLLHRRLSNIKVNYLHQSTNGIVKTKPYRIVMESLNLKKMIKNKHLSKRILKQCLYEFKRQIKYKCEKYGIEFIEADKWYPSSKMCSNCGNIKKTLRLSERTYTCDCGNSMDRDWNASINLSRYGLAD